MNEDNPTFFVIEQQEAKKDIYNIGGDLIINCPRPALTANPNETIYDIPDFTGRLLHLKEIRDIIEQSFKGSKKISTIISISGMPGVGKSALAIKAANSFTGAFSDFRLYTNLGGSTENEDQDPFDVLGGFLSRLGIDKQIMPNDLDGRAGLFRSLLANKSGILILDNAQDEKQVRPLLPGCSSCIVLITSRPYLSALEGAFHIKLDLMSSDESIELLSKIVGIDRIQSELVVAERILDYCGRLPLAIRIASGTIHSKEHWTLAKFETLLKEGKKRLRNLELGDLSVRAAFELSYRELPQREAKMFRLLGLFPGPEIYSNLGAALLDIDEISAFESVEKLVDLHLIEPTSNDHYMFHELIRLFAVEKTECEDSSEEVTVAGVRAAKWFLKISDEKEILLNPRKLHELMRKLSQKLSPGSLSPLGWPRIPSIVEEIGFNVNPINLARDRNNDLSNIEQDLIRNALTWFEKEHKNILKAMNIAYSAGSYDVVYRLYFDSVLFLNIRALWTEWEIAGKLAFEACIKEDNLHAIGLTLMYNGAKCHEQGQWDEALKLFESAHKIFRNIKDKDGEILTLASMGNIYFFEGQWKEAIKIYDEALESIQADGNMYAKGHILMNRAGIYLHQGRLEEALSLDKDVLKIFQDLGDKYSEGMALGNIGLIYFTQGQMDEAKNAYDRSLQIFVDFGSVHHKGNILHNIGIINCRRCNWDDALKAQEEALQIARDLGDKQGESFALASIGNILFRRGSIDKALMFYEPALKILHELGDKYRECNILINIGMIYQERGRMDEALKILEDTSKFSHDLDAKYIEGRVFLVKGMIYSQQNRFDEALEELDSALSIFHDIGLANEKALCLKCQGNIYYQQGIEDKALEAYDSALKSFRDMGDRLDEGQTLVNKSRIYGQQGRWDDALKDHEEALKIFLVS